MAKTSFFVTVEPTFTTDGRVRSIVAVSMTKQRPPRLARTGSVTVRLSLDIPDSAFLPLRPEVVIVVPEDMVKVNLPIEVVAVDSDARS